VVVQRCGAILVYYMKTKRCSENIAYKYCSMMSITAYMIGNIN